MFPVTPWSILVFNGTGKVSKETALEQWCSIYRKPIILAIRFRYQIGRHDAEDIAHDFIAWLLKKDLLEKVEKRRLTKFRTFLLECLKNFYRNYTRKQTAEKRGGKAGEHLLVHDSGNEDDQVVEITDESEPSYEVDRAWALATIEEVYSHLRTQFVERGKSELFDAFVKVINKADPTLAAAELGMKDGAFRAALSRFKETLKISLEYHIRQMVTTEDEVKEEMEFIMRFASAGAGTH
jgi:RNA polymerase sigma-70 factor (ECF subfamily)